MPGRIDSYGVGFTVGDVMSDLFHEVDQRLRTYHSGEQSNFQPWMLPLRGSSLITGITSAELVEWPAHSATGAERHFMNVGFMTQDQRREALVSLATVTYMQDETTVAFRPVSVLVPRGNEAPDNDFSLTELPNDMVHVGVGEKGITMFGQLPASIDYVGHSVLSQDTMLGSLSDEELGRLGMVSSAILDRVACIELVAEGCSASSAMSAAGMLVSDRA